MISDDILMIMTCLHLNASDFNILNFWVALHRSDLIVNALFLFSNCGRYSDVSDLLLSEPGKVILLDP